MRKPIGDREELGVDPVDRARSADIGSEGAEPVVADRATQSQLHQEPFDRATRYRDAFPIHLYEDLRTALNLHVGWPDTLDLGPRTRTSVRTGGATQLTTKLRRWARLERRRDPEVVEDQPIPVSVAVVTDKELHESVPRPRLATAKNAFGRFRNWLKRRIQ